MVRISLSLSLSISVVNWGSAYHQVIYANSLTTRCSALFRNCIAADNLCMYIHIYIYIKILFEFCYHVNLMLCREDVRCCMQWQNTSIADSSLRRSTRNWKSHATTDGKGMETLKDSTPMFFFNGFSSERCWWSVSTHTIEFLNWIL